MTITSGTGGNFKLNGLNVALNSVFVKFDGETLELVKKSDSSILLPLQGWDRITNGATGEKFANLTEFQTAVATIFSVLPPTQQAASATVAGVVKQAAAVANTAPNQSAAYVQADAQAVLTELRALKTSLIASGALHA